MSLKDVIGLGNTNIGGALYIYDDSENPVAALFSLGSGPTSLNALELSNSNGSRTAAMSSRNDLGGSFSIYNPLVGNLIAELTESASGGGALILNNINEFDVATLGADNVGGGFLGINNQIGLNVAFLTHTTPSGLPGGGFLEIDNSAGTGIAFITDNTQNGGYLGINNSTATEAARITTAGAGGYINVNNSMGSEAARLYYSATDGGFISVNNSVGTNVAIVTDNTNGGGFLGINNNAGGQRVAMTTAPGGSGFLNLNDGSGQPRVILTIDQNSGGAILTTAADGSDAVEIETVASGAGLVSLNNSAGTISIQLNGNTGVITATDFVTTGTATSSIAHPVDPDKDIYYVSLEGAEAGVYVRGTAQLIRGKARIQLPDHFSLVANAEGMTAQVTPRSSSSMGLAVIELSPQEIVVEELYNGNGNYEFDYMVNSVRQGFEDFQVVRDKEQGAKVDVGGEIIKGAPQPAADAAKSADANRPQ